MLYTNMLYTEKLEKSKEQRNQYFEELMYANFSLIHLFLFRNVKNNIRKN